MGKRAAASPSRVSVVTITRNRRESLLRTLAHLSALPERPPLIVVDNGSSDGTPFEVTARFPQIDFVPLPENRGAAARDIGVRLARTPYVAFSDDDSWWEVGALARAADLLDAHPGIAVVAARILVGEDGLEDPTCAQMARSPLGRPADAPGPLVLGFVACGAVARRSAYREAGGFGERRPIGGEERLLAADLAAAGWTIVYEQSIVARHHPSPARDRGARRGNLVRSELRFTWLRRPVGIALRTTGRFARAAIGDSDVRAGVLAAIAELPDNLRRRRRPPQRVERALRRLG